MFRCFGRANQLVDPIFSSDGKYLAAIANLQGSAFAYVPVVFRPTGEFVALGHPSRDFPEPGIAWSPANDQLMYGQAASIARTARLFLLDMNSGDDRLALGPDATGRRGISSFAWSPSGQWVAAGLIPNITPSGSQEGDGAVRIFSVVGSPRAYEFPWTSFGQDQIVDWAG